MIALTAAAMLQRVIVPTISPIANGVISSPFFIVVLFLPTGGGSPWLVLVLLRCECGAAAA